MSRVLADAAALDRVPSTSMEELLEAEEQSKSAQVGYGFDGGGSRNGSYVFEWDDETLIEVVVSLGPGVATGDQIAELIDGVRPATA